jgi:hypothetical protein
MQALVLCWQKCLASGADYEDQWYFVGENLLYAMA